MKAFLMYRDQDFDLTRALPPNAQDLVQDLGLDRLFDTMAVGDKFLRDVARKAVLTSLTDPREIVYRQQVLRDCIDHSSTVQTIYGIAVEAIDSERKILRSFFLRSPGSILHGSLEAMQMFIGVLKKLRALADAEAAKFRSEGFTAFFQMLKQDLDDDFFRRADAHLQQLQFRQGVLVSARLGPGNTGADYVLRTPRTRKATWRQWIPILDPAAAYTVVIADRDESGFRALGELRDQGVNLAANAVAQATDHVLSFFTMLRAEIAFYLGCLNLRSRLTDKGEPVCFPVPVAPGSPALSASGLYDPGLSLSLAERVVGNEIHADDRVLVMITGANQGGKSTFLRSVGVAHLMMQAGMFVAAEAFRANVCRALFTHYKREEDATMTSGKLDEELSRMSALAERVTPGSLVLFNESFSATNEREGAEIATAIVRALLEAGIKVGFVTHSFELAHGFAVRERDAALFLKAEREDDGRRTFRLVEGAPLPTSYGEDLYRRIFEETPDVVLAAPTT